MLAGRQIEPTLARREMPFSRYFDRIAIALSTICIVHCLAMPFVIALLPVAAFTFGSDGHFHALMLWFVVPTSVLGFGLGVRVHGRWDSVALGVVAIAGLATAALWGHSAWDPSIEVFVNVSASVLLAVAHWRNFREVRRSHRH
jgi:MerC mercury resistance protein